VSIHLSYDAQFILGLIIGFAVVAYLTREKR
jgi:hypothetical protein